MAYEFQGALYRNTAAMHRAIAAEWLSGGGLNRRETMIEFLAAASDADLAAEAESGWGLGESPEFSADELAVAFAEIRADLNAAFPADADD